MRSWPHLGTSLLLLAACTSTVEQSDPEAFRNPAPTFGDEATTQAPSSTPTTIRPVLSPPVLGVLPDGTVFGLMLGPNPPEEAQAVSARLGVDHGDGSSMSASIANFSRAVDTVTAPSWEEPAVFTSPAGPWVLRIALDEETLGRLGADYQEKVEAGIGTSTIRGFPVLELSEPFRYAIDEEFSLHMQVLYETFVVRPGCGDLAASCSQVGDVQLIPLPTTSRPDLPWSEDGEWIEVHRGFLASEPHPLDAGPLAR